jgi:hypothetical protein
MIYSLWESFIQKSFNLYSGKRLSEIQTKLCLAWFIARDTVPHTTAHRYILMNLIMLAEIFMIFAMK